jgi:Flp pilus assembly protein TadD
LTYSNLGDALWIAGRRGEATVAFNAAERSAVAALDIDPNETNRRMDLAWIRAMLGDSDSARSLIDSALAKAPDDPYVYYIDALIWLRADDAGEALSALQIAVDKGYPKTLLAAEPHLARLRQHPRFNEILTRGEID